MKNKLIAFVCFSVLLLSCDSGTVYEKGDYSVSWVDSKKNQALRFKHEGIIPECVSKLGENDSFIIVERVVLKTREIEYYIIDKPNYQSTWNKQVVQGIIGPMNSERFKLVKDSLNIPESIEFTIVSDNCK